jgi:hypothetical protein
MAYRGEEDGEGTLRTVPRRKAFTLCGEISMHISTPGTKSTPRVIDGVSLAHATITITDFPPPPVIDDVYLADLIHKVGVDRILNLACQVEKQAEPVYQAAYEAA